MQIYECAICGYLSENRAEFVEFLDTVKLPKVIEKARSRGRPTRIESVKYLCVRCSVEMYREEINPPRSIRTVCPRCGETVEIWF